MLMRGWNAEGCSPMRGGCARACTRCVRACRADQRPTGDAAGRRDADERGGEKGRRGGLPGAGGR